MKRLKFLVLLFIVLAARPCFGAFTESIDNRKTYRHAYRWTAKPKDKLHDWAAEVEDRLTGASTIEFTYYSPTDTEPAANAGTLYYDLSENKPKYYNGSSWIAIESGSAGNSLDGAYDVGNAITVDGSPVTLTTSTASGITALDIDHGGNSNNNDAFTIAMAGSGDGIQVTNEDTDSVAMRLIAAASQTVSLAVLDASTNNWIGADDVGLVHIQSDTALTDNGASLLVVINTTGRPKDNAEGFLARFVDTGTARTTAHAVEIETTNTTPALKLNNLFTVTGADSAGTLVKITGNDSSGNSDTMTINHDGTSAGLKITCDSATSVALEVATAASQTTTAVLIDGSTGNFIGANDVGMVQITKDTALTDAGSTLLLITNTAQPVASAEGFLVRLVDTGTATTTAYAMEIETKNTTPCLKLNNELVIAGADGSGTLLTVTSVNATGDADGIAITHSGSGDAIQITPTDVDSGGINMVGKAAGVVPLVILDSATNNWDGADDIGQLFIDNDDAYVHAGASAIVVTDSSTPISAAEGFLARFVHSGTAQTNSSAVEIEVPATQPALAMNGVLSIAGQNNIAAVLVQITGNDGGGNQDAMTINNEGTGDGLQITCDDVDTVGLNVIAATSQTTSLAKFDGATGSYLGAQNVGMIHVTSDGALAHVDSSLMYIANSGVPQDDARGTSLRIVDTGNASAGTAGYSVYIKTDDATMEALYIDEGNVLVDEEIVAGVGVQSSATARTATAGGGSTGLIARNTRHVTITCDDATKQIKLPAPIVGMKITLVTPALGVELIATGSSVKVNDVIVSATNEAALVADSHYEVTCVSATEWILVGYDKLGAHIAPIVPDSL
ncbi:hypothetical protein LCGC14_0538540 [marine sediment metagenome]|uniref:Uncharacterized protein n=1 Tax=marine sediment metagenome TaxID=412755 RepID=A0A0F9RY65_9ZZZZ